METLDDISQRLSLLPFMQWVFDYFPYIAALIVILFVLLGISALGILYLKTQKTPGGIEAVLSLGVAVSILVASLDIANALVAVFVQIASIQISQYGARLAINSMDKVASEGLALLNKTKN